MPSLYEGLPVVGVEAQASGLLCILSDTMTKETKVLESTKFNSLENNSLNWAELILNSAESYKRNNAYEEMTKNEFNIAEEKEKLENFYKKVSRINICHVVSALKSGGAESVIINYSTFLSKEDYNFFVLHQYKATDKSYKEFKDCNFVIREITPKKRNPLKNFIETKQFLRKNRIDIVHCHMTLGNFFPLIAAKQCKIKVRICHSHQCESKSTNPLKKILKYMCIKNSTILMACGNDAGKYMYGNRNFIILNNAINIHKYEYNLEKRMQIRKKYGISDDCKVIGHVGRFIEVKNHTFLIKIMKRLQKDNFILMLIGNGELEDAIKEEIHKNNLSNVVIFTGIVSNTNDYYSAFDFFALPSLYEGLPMVSLEAQASGLKCFFSNRIDNDCIVLKENCKMLPLDQKTWCDEILNSNAIYDRNKKIEEKFNNKNLNILKESVKLDKIYKENYYE